MKHESNGVVVTKQQGESNESLFRRFYFKVNDSGLLKDVKLSEMTQRERKHYKKFINERRKIKKQKRVGKYSHPEG